MINRYAREEMRNLFTDEKKFETWLQVELASIEAFSKQGLIDEATVQLIKENASFNIERIYEIENETHHDVVAFTRAVSESLGNEKKWIHYGLTSTDVVDTAFGYLYKQANDLILDDLYNLQSILKTRALEFKMTPCIGRTHGVHADITSFGLKFALWYDECNRHIERFKAARRTLEVGKISGAVGNYANTSPLIQDYVCQKLGLESSNISTQVLQRDRHAHFMSVLVLITSFIEKMALEVRHLQRTEVSEAQEYFRKGQKGSSAMPHKKNPIASENVTGLSRVMRGYLVTAFEDIALWHERDISHSSAERVIFPDAYMVTDYVLSRYTKVLQTLVVHEDQMLRNIELTHGVIYAQRVMHILMDEGDMSRETAYDIIQPLALRAYEDKSDFKTLLLSSELISDILNQGQIESAFDVGYFLREVDTIYKRVGIEE